MADAQQDNKIQNAGWGMLLVGFVGGALAWHYAAKAMQNYGRNRSIDDRMSSLDAIYAKTIPGALQPGPGPAEDFGSDYQDVFISGE